MKISITKTRDLEIKEDYFGSGAFQVRVLMSLSMLSLHDCCIGISVGSLKDLYVYPLMKCYLQRIVSLYLFLILKTHSQGLDFDVRNLWIFLSFLASRHP